MRMLEISAIFVPDEARPDSGLCAGCGSQSRNGYTCEALVLGSLSDRWAA